MSRNKRLGLSVGLLVVLALVAVSVLSVREPTYQGRTLRAWLQDLTAPPGTPRAQAATEAIATWGTNALPQLVQALHKPETPVRDFFRRLLGQGKPPHFLALDEPDLRVQALAAFRILGPAAAPAGPRLQPLLEDRESDALAAQALVLVGSNGVERLVGALTHTNAEVRLRAELALSSATEEVPLIVPALVGCLNDTDRLVELGAVSALQQLARMPAVSVPALLRKSQTPDSQIRRRCFAALTAFGPGAKSAVPAILAAYAAPTSAELDEQMGLLNQIAPEVVPATLAQGLRHTNAAVRIAFLTAVEKLPHRLDSKSWQLVQPPLLENLRHPEASVRRAAIRLARDFESWLDAPARKAVEQAIAQEPGGFKPEPRYFFWYPPVLTPPQIRSWLASYAGWQFAQGGVVRGPSVAPKVAFVFTGHQFAEGAEVVLNELAKHKGKASFFLTGDFLDNPQFRPLIRRIIKEGHYVGPHSDRHLLYCTWEPDRKTLVSHDEFIWDLWENVRKLTGLGVNQHVRYFLPAYEHYNPQIVDWACEMQLQLVNYTPGTRSNADYTGEADKNFVSSQTIFQSIVAQEQQSTNGLNGFLLLLHLGVGPGRSDKFHPRFGELLDYLSGKGYQFVSLEELLDPRDLPPGLPPEWAPPVSPFRPQLSRIPTLESISPHALPLARTNAEPANEKRHRAGDEPFPAK